MFLTMLEQVVPPGQREWSKTLRSIGVVLYLVGMVHNCMLGLQETWGSLY